MTHKAYDIGLGTTYERFALNAWLMQSMGEYPLRTVLEGPGDGMAGILGLNSLVFGRQRIRVVVVLEDMMAIDLARKGWRSQHCLDCVQFLCSPGGRIPIAADQFDLVWNFNRLPFYDPRALVVEMVRLSRRYVALVVPNRRNYGFPARRLYHRRTRLPWPHGNTAVMDPGTVRGLLEEAGLRVLEVRWLDVPWWPDILDPTEWFSAMVPGARRLLSHDQRDRYCRGPEDLPYFDPLAYADLHQRMHRLGWLERVLPALLQVPFAHHFAVLAVKESADA
jgi:hypothetical protein